VLNKESVRRLMDGTVLFVEVICGALTERELQHVAGECQTVSCYSMWRASVNRCRVTACGWRVSDGVVLQHVAGECQPVSCYGMWLASVRRCRVTECGDVSAGVVLQPVATCQSVSCYSMWRRVSRCRVTACGDVSVDVVLQHVAGEFQRLSCYSMWRPVIQCSGTACGWRVSAGVVLQQVATCQ
jgi:hypothetical protein